MAKKQVTPEEAKVLQGLGYTVHYYYDPTEAPGQRRVLHKKPERIQTSLRALPSADNRKSNTSVSLTAMKMASADTITFRIYDAARIVLIGQQGGRMNRRDLMRLIIRETELAKNSVQPALSFLRKRGYLRFTPTSKLHQ